MSRLVQQGESGWRVPIHCTNRYCFSLLNSSSFVLCVVVIFCRQNTITRCNELHNKSSAVAEMGDRGHNRYGPKRGGVCPFRGSWDPVSTMWPGSRPARTPSFILIRPTVWPQYTNVIDRPTGQDRETDRQTTVLWHRANRFTTARPKTCPNV